MPVRIWSRGDVGEPLLADGAVGAVDQDAGQRVVLPLLLAVVLDRREHREGGDGARVGELHLVASGPMATTQSGQNARGRHEHQAARRAPLAHDAARPELVAEALRQRAHPHGVVEGDELLHEPDGAVVGRLVAVGHAVAHAPPPARSRRCR